VEEDGKHQLQIEMGKNNTRFGGFYHYYCVCFSRRGVFFKKKKEKQQTQTKKKQIECGCRRVCVKEKENEGEFSPFFPGFFYLFFSHFFPPRSRVFVLLSRFCCVSRD
jgi:hypothetical protein